MVTRYLLDYCEVVRVIAITVFNAVDGSETNEQLARAEEFVRSNEPLMTALEKRKD